MKIVIIGPQGSGKGTQGQLLEKYGMKHISLGNYFRERADKGDALGIQAKEYWKNGNLVPDKLVLVMLKQALGNSKKFVLDGFPRSIEQAKALDSITQIDKAIYLEISDKTSIKRLSSRKQCKCGVLYGLEQPEKIKGKCDKCGSTLFVREDDKPEAISNRLKQYHEITEPVLAFYEKKALLKRVDGEKSVEAIHNNIKKILGVQK
ncbi:nucleoside monophosphate kinase [Candidatus Woesearchaeota archaeon]|nr:nucleoside monophosphate kinase [Candidatus Woesearchaeota archaeon]